MESNKHSFWLIISFILIGFIALIAQSVIVRELLVVFLGNELCLGIIFSVWLIGIALGAWLAALLIDRVKHLYSSFIVILIVMTIILPFQIYFIRVSRGFLAIPIGQPIPFMPMLLLSINAIIPFSILIGIVFPLACRIYTQNHPESIRGGQADNNTAIRIGWVYIYEAIGSLLGGIVFTFFLVDHFDSFTAIIITNCLMLLVALILSGLMFESINRKIMMGLVVVFLVVNLSGIFVWSKSLNQYAINKRWQTFNPAEELMESVDSRYENLVISRIQDQYQLYGNGQIVASFPNDYTYEPLAHFFLTEHPDPQRILLIGGGSEGFLSHILKHPSVRELHYVQIDSKMIELTAKYLPETDKKLISERTDPRLFIHYSDGRYFVKHTSDKFDLIIINVSDPSTALVNRFYTIDFFRESQGILRAGGVVVTSASSAVNYFGDTVGNYTGSVYDTLNAVFKFVLVSPGDRAYFFATNQSGIITFDINELDKRFKERLIVSDKFVSPASYGLILQESDISFIQKALQERKEHYINTDLQPISYFFNLVLWDTILKGGGGQSGSIFGNLKKLKFNWVIILICVLLILRLIYVAFTPKRILYHQRFNILFAIFFIGFAGLALEFILLFSFQNIYGYIYQKVGFIVALFMFGLALGGIISNKFIMIKRYNWGKILTFISVLVGILSVFMPFIIEQIARWSVTEYIFVLLIAISGLLTGLVYPVANRLYLESGVTIGKTAGLIDSADHLGAFSGALFTGIIFIPIFGMFQTCFFIAILSLAPAIFLRFGNKTGFLIAKDS